MPVTRATTVILRQAVLVVTSEKVVHLLVEVPPNRSVKKFRTGASFVPWVVTFNENEIVKQFSVTGMLLCTFL